MKASKNYTEIAEKLENEYSDILSKTYKECRNILTDYGGRIVLDDDDTDYNVTIYEDNNVCKLKTVFFPERQSASIYLDLYCYEDKVTYTTNMLNTDLQPTNLLTTLAAKVCNNFHVEKYLDHYTYQIEEIFGEKIIHIDGYVYWNETHYDLVQACGCYIPISDLNYESGEEKIIHIDNIFSASKQYQGVIKEEEIISYYNPEKNKVLQFFKITEDTPCGFYVS